jgi:hypothetical protein
MAVASNRWIIHAHTRPCGVLFALRGIRRGAGNFQGAVPCIMNLGAEFRETSQFLQMNFGI